MVVFTGCSFISKDEDKKEENQSPKEYATEQSEYIMECIVNKDKEGLKSVFSKHIAETHDLDKEIDEFLKFIDGEIISYDEPEGHEGREEMYEALRIGVKNNRKDLIKNFIFYEDGYTVWIIWDKKEEMRIKHMMSVLLVSN